MASKKFYVYFLTNFQRTVLYVGVTNDLVRRVWEHTNNLVEGFTQKYKVHNLIYYEIFEDIKTAIEREKQIKSWSRKRKENLIKQSNPTLKTLNSSIL